MINKYAIFSNDVETTSIWLNSLNDETGMKVYREGMPILLDLYRKYNIKSTFFYTGYIARLVPDIVKMVISDGHEIGSHGLSHKKEYGFDIMPYYQQVQHLRESKDILENISGNEVISFRSPALRVGRNTAAALLETGYKIDSSVASQRFDFFMSFGGIKKLNWLFAPRLPYRTKSEDIFKRGDSHLVEIPLSAFLVPYISTIMRIFPTLSSFQRMLHHLETTINNKPVVFDIHPNELIDESYLPRTVNRRVTSQIAYFLQDYLRSNIKVKNLGDKAVSLYEKELLFFLTRQYQFVTMKQYCEINNHL